ncbi:MAG: carbohydrate binding family 9 domain-containing protein [Deltaproteobacteria bacterium]|nr:carbohydrate binding family 9 domain-containing protein [Deltaproteobacteria bacterium]
MMINQVLAYVTMGKAASITTTLILGLAFTSSLVHANESRKVARVVRATVAPTIDGILDDPAWKEAPWHDEFVQRRPKNGVAPSLKTRFAVAFDDEEIYIAVRCDVPDRDSIVTRLKRRDRGGDFDMVSITLAPRDDGRTGYSFAVNPDGVQRDVAWRDDNKQDGSWDAVWRAETSIQDTHWSVEMAIPIDQIRFPEGLEKWGIQVSRWISSRQENVVFNPVPPEKAGWISATGKLVGVEQIEPRQPLSLTPETHFLHRSTTSEFGGRGKDGFEFGAGGYAKTGVGPDLVLDLAVNPDFGQVEVDEAVLNLSAYEIQFQEKRPFFLEGAGLFETPIQLFYSRRLGAPPPDPTLDSRESVKYGPTSTPILSAAKLTGRSASGLSVGMIEAVFLPTEFGVQDDATGGTRLRNGSPWASASVLRLSTEPRANSTLGLLGTAYNPSGSNGSYSGGVDWNLLDAKREYSFRGQVAGSLRFDEVLGKEANHGAGLWTRFAREGGEHFRFSGHYQVFGKGFDPNDLGFIRRDDLQNYSLDLQFRQVEAVGPFAQVFAGVRPSGYLTTDGMDLGQNASAYLSTKWLSDWVTELGAFGGLAHHDDREARGGPPMGRPSSGGGWIWIRAAQRKMLGGYFNISSGSKPAGYFIDTKLTLILRLARLELELAPGFEHTKGDLAYVATLDDDAPEDTTVIGNRDLNQLDLSFKGTLVILRNLTFQVLSQLLVAKADYNRYQLLLEDSSTVPQEYLDDDADFVRTDMRIQALVRWEYLPGSTLYVVYTHFGFVDLYGSDWNLGHGVRYLDDEEREQLFMIKLSHRFG